MAKDLTEHLVIGISSSALFDLTIEDELFRTKGVEEYSKYQIENEDVILKPGAAFNLVSSILNLNKLKDNKRFSEVVIMSKNSSDTSLRIFNSIEHYGLDISRAALTSGSPLSPYLDAFSVDLFLSTDHSDVKLAREMGCASAQILLNKNEYAIDGDLTIKIAFDGDAVLFSDESERIYQKMGPEAFFENEILNSENPLPEGPFAKFLMTLSRLQKEFPEENNPIRTALVTARNSPAHKRVILTLRTWGVRIDEAFFMGGVRKDKVLKAFGAQIFFDDQDVHLEGAAKVVPSAKVF